MSTIEWLARPGTKPESWNPIRGCSLVSEGCRSCYAMKQAHRFSGAGKPYFGLTEIGPNGPRWTGRVVCDDSKLSLPLHWREPRTCFVVSMGDPFHADVSDDFLDRMHAVEALCPQHTFVTLTKRAERMQSYYADPVVPFRVQRAMDAVSVDEEMRGQTEEWREVAECRDYSVSTFGRVRSNKGVVEKELAQSQHGQGYAQVAICVDGKPRTRLVHALVLEAFVGPPVDGAEARHRNGVKTDNRIANLSWGTKTDNMQDSARHGTAGAWMKGRSTLSVDAVAEIRRRRDAGETLSALAEAFGADKQQISAIALGKIYRQAELTWPLPNVWLGISVEDQATADQRIPLLLQTPAAVRVVSVEPMLGPVDFRPGNWTPPLGGGPRLNVFHPWEPIKHGIIDWLIVGGESGPKARPCDVAWIRSTVRQCKAAGVPCFVKQLGPRPFWYVDGSPGQDAYGNVDDDGHFERLRVNRKGNDPAQWPEDLRVREWPPAVCP